MTMLLDFLGPVGARQRRRRIRAARALLERRRQAARRGVRLPTRRPRRQARGLRAVARHRGLRPRDRGRRGRVASAARADAAAVLPGSLCSDHSPRLFRHRRYAQLLRLLSGRTTTCRTDAGGASWLSDRHASTTRRVATSTSISAASAIGCISKRAVPPAAFRCCCSTRPAPMAASGGTCSKTPSCANAFG